MRAPEVIAPRVLGYDIEPQNAIGSPFILQSGIGGCDLLHCSINKTFWQNFSFVSIFAMTLRNRAHRWNRVV